MRVQLTRNNFATGPAADHFYPWRNVGSLEGRVGVSERELERRLKLDLLISAGNVAVALSVSYLIKPSFRNSHATICHRCNQQPVVFRSRRAFFSPPSAVRGGRREGTIAKDISRCLAFASLVHLPSYIIKSWWIVAHVNVKIGFEL